MNKLATINPDRFIARNERNVHILWDDHDFELTRTEFVRVRHVIERGLDSELAEDGDLCSVVQVDDERAEVWIQDTCLTLAWRDYAKLLNAMLTSETRLHGIRMGEDEWHVYERNPSTTQTTVEIQPIMTIRPPKPPMLYQN